MADIVLSDIGSGYNRTKINSNFTVLEEVVNNGLLHLDGGNNIMKQNIDMDSNDIINVGTMQAQTITINGTDYAALVQASADAALVSETNAAASEVAAAASEANAALSLSEFRDTYWGAYASEPALSPEGTVAEAGDLYFDTTDGVMKVYNDTLDLWIEAVSGVNGVKENATYTNVAGQDTFAINYQSGFCDVYLNGVKLVVGTDYTAVTGTEIVLTTPVANASDVVELVAFNQVDFDVLTAATLTYDNTTSGLTGVNVQEVFDTPSNAAGRLVQTSASDFTAGLVALTDGLSYVDPRQFGLGGDAVQTTNLNTATTSGKYWFDASPLNPPSFGGYGHVEVTKFQTSVTQVAKAYLSDAVEFRRSNDSGSTWSAWKRIDPQAFGLGGESVLSVIDWNNLDEATLLNPVLSNSGSLNGPPSSEPYYYPQVMKYQNGNVVQIAWPYRVGIGGIWIRSRYDTVWSDWQPVYTGLNYQPETSNGLGVVRFMKNNSGASITANGTIDGASLSHYYIDASGVMQQAGTNGGAGTTWKNVSGSNVGNGNGVEFVRIS